MRRRWQKSRRQRRTTALNRRISRSSIETAIPSSRPERCNADARSGGQGRPKGAARRREASLTVASTTASWARRDVTATRVNHHENPLTPIDALRPRRAPNQHIQPVIAEPRPGKRCLAASRRGARPTAPSMRGFSPPLTPRIRPSDRIGLRGFAHDLALHERRRAGRQMWWFDHWSQNSMSSSE